MEAFKLSDPYLTYIVEVSRTGHNIEPTGVLRIRRLSWILLFFESLLELSNVQLLGST